MTQDNPEGFIYGAGDFLEWALASGWRPSVLPVGVIYTFQPPVTQHLTESPRFAENRELTVSNARTFMTQDDGPPILVVCLNPGGASMATQLEHLCFLGDSLRCATIVGTAGSLTERLAIGESVVVGSALRDDGISDRYLPPDPVVTGDPDLVAELERRLGVTPALRSWTVAVPYRSTNADLAAARRAGAAVVEMEIATLFAVARALNLESAATVVVSDVKRVEGWEVEWRDTTAPLLRALDATIAAIRSRARPATA